MSGRPRVGGLGDGETGDILTRAVGMWSSMTEYLAHPVAGPEALGIHDNRLWRLQALVADRPLASEAPTA
jgi:cation transport protein ChaC